MVGRWRIRPAWPGRGPHRRRANNRANIDCDPAHAVDIAGQYTCGSRDGCLWAVVAGKGLCRFDGREWSTVVSEKEELGLPAPVQTYQVLAGMSMAPLDKGVLGTMSGGYILTSGTSFSFGKTLTALIDADRQFARRALAGQPRCDYYSYQPVVADGRGNLWLVAQRVNCQVLPNGQDKWLDVDVGTKSTALGGALATGDSTVIIRRYDSIRRGWECLFATFADGRAEVTPGPVTDQQRSLVLDKHGDIWAAKPLYDGTNVQTAATLIISGTRARRIFESYMPEMADRSGGVWLRPLAGALAEDRAARTILLARSDGTIAASALLPELNSRLLACDGGGGIWATSALGPVRLTPPAGQAGGDQPPRGNRLALADRAGPIEYKSTLPHRVRLGDEDVMPGYGAIAATSGYLPFMATTYSPPAGARYRPVLMPIPRNE
ncbi:MAG: hypothetical protein ACE15C_12115 [Phycisphaerae bacterium]